MAEAVGSGRLLPEYELPSIGDVLRLRQFYVSIYTSNQLGTTSIKKTADLVTLSKIALPPPPLHEIVT